MIVGIMWEFLDVEKNGGILRRILCKKDVFKILRRQTLMAGNEIEFFVAVNIKAPMEMEVDLILSNPIGLKMFRETVKKIMCFWKVEGYWNEKDGKKSRVLLVLVQIYSEKVSSMMNMMNCGVFVMYLVYEVLQSLVVSFDISPFLVDICVWNSCC